MDTPARGVSNRVGGAGVLGAPGRRGAGGRPRGVETGAPGLVPWVAALDLKLRRWERGPRRPQ
jgi:hypothetical protein